MMRHILSFLFVFVSLAAFAQKADMIVGHYISPKKDGILQIYKAGAKYNGRLLWTRTIGKTDENNPDPAKRKALLKGSDIMKDFVFDGEDTWENGTIYDPNNGKTYSCEITRMANGDLNVRGYIGISLLGRTEVFVKTGSDVRSLK
jgi:uncharacterized protein (DUF2147 family)